MLFDMHLTCGPESKLNVFCNVHAPFSLFQWLLVPGRTVANRTLTYNVTATWLDDRYKFALIFINRTDLTGVVKYFFSGLFVGTSCFTSVFPLEC